MAVQFEYYPSPNAFSLTDVEEGCLVILCRMTLFRFGGIRFEREVNRYLSSGYKLEKLYVQSRGWFRTHYFAALRAVEAR